jgi:hypothetical protein
MEVLEPPPLETEEGWRIPAHAAVVLFPEREKSNPDH